MRTLAHHFAKLAGEDEGSVAGISSRFDKQDVPAEGRPSKSRRHTGKTAPHSSLVLEYRRAENVGEISYFDRDRVPFAFRYANRGVTQHFSDLTFEISDASLARIVRDDVAQSNVGNFDLIGAYAVGFHLPAHQIAACDL